MTSVVFLSALALLLPAQKPTLPPTIPLSIERGTMIVGPYKDGPIPAYPWRALAACESGNAWSIDTANGYYGGLQIDWKLWNGYKPDGVLVETPDRATPLAQVMAARNLIRTVFHGNLAEGWPNCARRMGLAEPGWYIPFAPKTRVRKGRTASG
jgi:hypothetical protein